MTLREIFERCLVLSGQFLIDKSLIELDEERFIILFKQEKVYKRTNDKHKKHKKINSIKLFISGKNIIS